MNSLMTKKSHKVLKGCSTHHLHGVSFSTVDNEHYSQTFRGKTAVLDCSVSPPKRIFHIPADTNLFAAACKAVS